jgi:superoxide dismutase, Fe-Mn family
MRHQILPIPRKPYALSWLPERLIVSHYENDYGASVRSSTSSATDWLP